MTSIDWFALLHPVLMILFVYPVIGATIRLGILVRERRLGITEQPAAVHREHVDHGAWVTTGVVVALLIALLYSVLRQGWLPPAALAGSQPRVLLLLVAAGTLASLVALLQVRRAPQRAGFALLCWGGLFGLGGQPEVWRVTDNPFSAGFWSSHFWSGLLLCGLLLFTTAARPEIRRLPRLRRLHLALNLLVMVLLAVQAITGCRDLLEMPLSWQMSTIWGCDPVARTCPPFASPPSPPPASTPAATPHR
ncbi:MAG: DUF4079 family protein [Cyanobium sp.]